MAAVNVVAPGRVQSWIRKTVKQFLPNSTWDQLSNVYETSQSVPMAGAQRVPNAVVQKITDQIKQGQYSVTMLSVRKTGAAVIGGPNSADGKESKPTTKTCTVYFTNQRFPKSLPDMSVMGNMNDFYNIAETTIQMIASDFAEQTDYDHQRAMVAQCDELLSDSSYWEDSEYGSDISTPLSDVLHPNIYWWSGSAATKNTWNATYATAVTNLATAIDASSAMGTGATFDISALDSIHLIATRNIIPIGGMAGEGQGNKEIQYVLKISDAQYHQLVTDTGSNQWKDLLKYTEKGFDRMFSGYCGVYKGMMIVVDQRAPLFNISGATAGAFQYYTPLADNRTRVAKGDNTGTVEVAMLMGRNALGVADVKSMDLVRDDKDYKFVNSICGHRMRGTQRLDLDTTVAATSGRVNETSFLFLTSTTAAVITT